MRELVLRVPAGALDEVLDRILPLVPAGVRERALPGGRIELSMRGAVLPSADAIRGAVDFTPCELSEREVSDDWRRRRLDDYRPDVIGGRLVVRPQWAPAPGARLLDVVLRESSAFGAGTHPTTRTCLELLLEMEPLGAFADLGCGTGVLAIVASKLGWAPVTAVDVVPAAVAATVVNAAVNRAEIRATAGDIRSEPIPHPVGFAANVPAAVHEAIAAGWRTGEPPVRGLISGIGPEQIDPVIAAYHASGLVEAERREPHGWVVSVLARH
jgi:ribosomal protein L11 methyltransferase